MDVLGEKNAVKAGFDFEDMVRRAEQARGKPRRYAGKPSRPASAR
jgi:hypothetical protein